MSDLLADHIAGVTRIIYQVRDPKRIIPVGDNDVDVSPFRGRRTMYQYRRKAFRLWRLRIPLSRWQRGWF